MFIARQLTVTANGTYDLGKSPTSSYSYKIDGTFGSGSVEVGYISRSGSFVAYTDITALTAAGQGVVDCGNGSSVAFKLSGATAPTLYLQVNPV